MTARTLGDLVLAFHFAFIVFAVLGGFLVLWKPWIAWLHVPSVLWSAFVNLFNQVCPLTPLENRFRYLAGQAGYEGGFIQHYLTPLVYPGVMPEHWGLLAGYSVLIWNVLVYMLVVTLRRRGSLREAARSAHRDHGGAEGVLGHWLQALRRAQRGHGVGGCWVTCSIDQVVVRFGVGDADGPRSAMWRLWTQKGTCDVYIAARTLGGVQKVSLHESGVWRFAFTSVYWEGRASTGDEDRLIERWNR